MIKYGLTFADNTDPLSIEFTAIRKGGLWEDSEGFVQGLGLFAHYKNAMTLMWPHHDWHRWADLILRRIVENDVSVFMGSGDSGKTYGTAKFVLTDWWSDPWRTLWMVSSTTKQGADLRIWGKIKELFNQARLRFPWLPGFVHESRNCIVPDTVLQDQSFARTLTKGIVFIPCKQGETWLGLGDYAGIKPPKDDEGKEGRMGHAGDEVSLMHPTFLDAYANWYGKAHFRGILDGNPGALEDPLCTAGEPECGWENWRDTGKTQEWRSKFYNAWVTALDGRDSPNYDHPIVNGKVKYSYLIGPKKIEAIRKKYGENDWHWWNQCVGKPSTVNQARRIITRALCEAKHAFDDVLWKSAEQITWVCSLDAAYGGVGGDRCIIRRGAFGPDMDGNQILLVLPPDTVPVSVLVRDITPEDQIARFCKDYCTSWSIPPEHFFFDGRSTLAVAMAREWSPLVNVVDFAGAPSKREVTDDEFKWQGDTQTTHLVRADELFFNFVSELWFMTYYVIHSQQLRGLDRETAAEMYKRTWDMRGAKKQVEPKNKMKERTLESPDLGDALVTLIEGARRLGFRVALLPTADSRSDFATQHQWLQNELDKLRDFRKESELSYASVD